MRAIPRQVLTPAYALIWSDEFNAKTIDKNQLEFETGNNGWGTQGWNSTPIDPPKRLCVPPQFDIWKQEKKNASVPIYISTNTTKSKKELKYGRIDIRAKVPVPNGIMLPLRMLGSNIDEVGWPTCGEIDIMQLPHLENVIYNYVTLEWLIIKAATNSG